MSDLPFRNFRNLLSLLHFSGTVSAVMKIFYVWAVPYVNHQPGLVTSYKLHVFRDTSFKEWVPYMKFHIFHNHVQIQPLKTSFKSISMHFNAHCKNYIYRLDCFQNYANLWELRRVDSLEKTLMLGGIGGRRRGEDRGWDGGWLHWLDGRESEWTPGVGDGQGGLACCDSWGRKDRHDWVTELNWWEFWFLWS